MLGSFYLPKRSARKLILPVILSAQGARLSRAAGDEFAPMSNRGNVVGFFPLWSSALAFPCREISKLFN